MGLKNVLNKTIVNPARGVRNYTVGSLAVAKQKAAAKTSLGAHVVEQNEKEKEARKLAKEVAEANKAAAENTIADAEAIGATVGSHVQGMVVIAKPS